jgi:hypothetical protein
MLNVADLLAASVRSTMKSGASVVNRCRFGCYKPLVAAAAAAAAALSTE